MTHSSFSNIRLPVLWLMLVLMVVMPVRGLLAMDDFDCGHDGMELQSMQGQMQGMAHHLSDGLQATAAHDMAHDMAQDMECCDTPCDCNNCAAVSIPLITALVLSLSPSLLSSEYVVMDTTQFVSMETRPLLQPPAA